MRLLLGLLLGLGWKILPESQQDELIAFFHVQAQAVFDVTTFDFVIVEEIEGEGKGRALINDQMVMRQPERFIELLVVIVVIAMI